MTQRIKNGLVFGIFFIMIAAMVVTTVPKPIIAQTHFVGVPGSGATYNSIQAAINIAQNGDTIRVWAGTYNENIIVNKTLSIIGNGTTNTTIDGGWSGDVVKITADYVNISGFTIKKSGNNSGDAGIELSGSFSNNITGCNIYNVNITNCSHGIYLAFADINYFGTSSAMIDLKGNIRNSIKIYYSKENIFTNIEISQITTNNNSIHGSAIYLHDNSLLNTINDTIVKENYDTSGPTYYDGIFLYNSSYSNTIRYCEVKNTKNGINCSYLSGSNLIEKCEIHSNKENGIYIGQCSGNLIQLNKQDGSDTWGIHDNDKHGVCIMDTPDGHGIVNNYIYNNNQNNNNTGDGIYIQNSLPEIKLIKSFP